MARLTATEVRRKINKWFDDRRAILVPPIVRVEESMGIYRVELVLPTDVTVKQWAHVDIAKPPIFEPYQIDFFLEFNSNFTEDEQINGMLCRAMERYLQRSRV